MNKEFPTVSIIIPCYNEIQFIQKCLDSLIKNDYPKEKIEILIYDGGSNDGTLEILKKFQKKYTLIKIFHNPYRHQVKALNMGIKKAKGEIIIRCDAHSEYPPNYISEIVKYLLKGEAANVGGVYDACPSKDTCIAKAIAFALKHPFGVGFSSRFPGQAKPKFADTVPFGAWKKKIFEEVGLFDERFIRAQDLEHNVRLKKYGKKILLLPFLRVKYYARPTLRELISMAYQYGYSQVVVLRKHKILVSYRKIFPPMFVCGSFFLWIEKVRFLYFLYVLLGVLFGTEIALKEKRICFLFLMPIVFFILHFFYGIGFLKALIDWLIFKFPLTYPHP